MKYQLMLLLFICLTLLLVGVTKVLLWDDYTWSCEDLNGFPVFSKGWYPHSHALTTLTTHQYHRDKTEGVFKCFEQYVRSVLGTFSTDQRLCDRRLWVRLKSTQTTNSDISHLAFLLGLGNDQPIPIPAPFVLITTDGDNTPQTASLRKEFDYLLRIPELIKWYSQNCESDHPKMRPIPIGLDLHTYAMKRSQLATLRQPWTLLLTESHELMNEMNTINLSGPSTREQTIVYDLGSSTHPERKQVREMLAGRNSNVTVLRRRQSFVDLWKRYSQCEAGVSVRGNGLDCHRTWEMLYLGMIPIVRRQHSPFDRLFEGLPVVVVDDWKELLREDIMQRIRAVRTAYPSSTPWLHEEYWLADYEK